MESSPHEDGRPDTRDRVFNFSFSEPFYRDAEIGRVVVSTLVQNAMLPEGTVWVRVSAGWVTLKGQVDWHSQRAAASVLARCVPGVRGVTNVIAVARPMRLA
ncbi:MAG TPA: BON domain-containing protein [Vicinamibacterales bacterium]